MNSDTLIYIWIFLFPIEIIEFSTPRKRRFWIYFSSLHIYRPPITWNSLLHTSWGEMKRCEKCDFQLLKISWNIKTKCVTEFILTVRSSSMKDYSSHYGVRTKKTNVYINFNKINEILNFFTRIRVFKHKDVFSKQHVCRNGLGKMWASYIFHFSTRIVTSIHTKGFNIFFA